MDHADMVRVVEKYFEAYNKQDVEGVLSLYAADATMEDPVGSPPAESEAAMRELYEMGFEMGVSIELDGRVRTAAEFALFPMCATSENGKLYIINELEFNTEGKISKMRAFWSLDNLEGEMDVRPDLDWVKGE